MIPYNNARGYILYNTIFDSMKCTLIKCRRALFLLLTSLGFNHWTATLSSAFTLPTVVSQPPSRLSPSKSSSYTRRPTTQLYGYIPGIEVSDVTYDSVSTAFDAWEWTNAIGAPAALVAGAVLVTLGETRETTAPRKGDSHRTRILKLSMRFLLLTSFALEVVSIFTATITGTVLLGQSQHATRKMIGYDAPLQLMKHHHEYVHICCVKA